MSSPLDLLERLARGDLPSPRSVRLRHQRLVALIVVLSLNVILTSCGVVSVPPGPPSVTVTPDSAQPFQSENVQFSAIVQNAGNAGVNWEVNKITGGNATVGMIDSNGLYHAPALVPNPPTVTVTAALQSSSNTTGSSNVTVLSFRSIESLSLSPALSSVTPSQALQMQILTAGLGNSMVNWSVDGVPGGNATSGTITTGGVYSPPNAAGAHLITASLQANPSALGSTQVEVSNFSGVFTWRNDNSRSGVNEQELALAPSTVSSATFGKLFSCPLDGYAYAQPLYVANVAIPGNGIHNIVFVATEMDSVFAFDADANPCVQLWKTSLIPPGSEAIPTPNLDITSNDIAPYLGITGTPVIDPNSSTLYVAVESRSTGSNPGYSQILQALDLGTGQPKIQTVGSQITSSGATLPPFSPLLENQRAALLLDNDTVYIAFGSHGGQGNYHGWLFGYSASTMQQMSQFNVTPNGMQGGGVWHRGGGPAADANHNIFILTGDGPFDAYRGGSSYSDSFLRLGPGASSVADYFTPCNEVTLASAGLDAGASAPLLLPDSAGSLSQPHLMVGASKAGSLYVASRDNLGGYNSVCPDASSRVQTVPVGDGPILSTPIFWSNAVYVAAGNGKLKAFPVTSGTIAPSPLVSQSPEMFGPQGATPVISAKSTSNAILWLIDSSGAFATPNTSAILRAFDPNNLSNEIYNSALQPSRDSAGLAVKFTVPTVANAKVYVGTQTELDVYGFLH